MTAEYMWAAIALIAVIIVIAMMLVVALIADRQQRRAFERSTPSSEAPPDGVDSCHIARPRPTWGAKHRRRR